MKPSSGSSSDATQAQNQRKVRPSGRSLEVSGLPRFSEASSPQPWDLGEPGPAGSRAAPARWVSRPPAGGPLGGADEGGSGGRASEGRKCAGPAIRLWKRSERAAVAGSRGPCQYKDKWPRALADQREGSPRRGPARGRPVGITPRCRWSAAKGGGEGVGSLRAAWGRGTNAPQPGVERGGAPSGAPGSRGAASPRVWRGGQVEIVRLSLLFGGACRR